MPVNSINVHYFSDILCVWAYISQVRVDELKHNFGDKVKLETHYNQIFGSVKSKVKQNWDHRGGLKAYSQHVSTAATEFPHIKVHEDIWLMNTPTSSASCHLFLKAVHLLEKLGEITPLADKTNADALAWQFRLAFFTKLIDVTKLSNQLAIATEMGLDKDKILAVIQSGEAFAELEEDRMTAEKFGVKVSPTIVLNEGRQTLSGNVGYKVIEANVQELIDRPSDRASWC